jgi:hypothetical protein
MPGDEPESIVVPYGGYGCPKEDRRAATKRKVCRYVNMQGEEGVIILQACDFADSTSACSPNDLSSGQLTERPDCTADLFKE